MEGVAFKAPYVPRPPLNRSFLIERRRIAATEGEKPP